MKRLVYLLAVACVVLIAQSCEKYVIGPADIGDVTYSEDVQGIFEAKCVFCHGASDPAAGLNLSDGASYAALINGDFINTDDPESSELYTKLLAGSHAAYTDVTQRAIILKWIEDGAPEN